MLTNIKLSIITINFNNYFGLRKTMQSVLAQTSMDFEYIIIDGGSADGSVEVIKSFTKNPPGTYIPKSDEQTNNTPITYWISEPDAGIYNAMNKGIMVAKGEYCQFLNSGDWLWKNDVTARMLADIPPTSIIYGNKIREYNGEIKIEKSFQGRQITLLDLYKSTIFHATTYIKRTLFKKYGLYDESLKIVSDWKFFLITVGLNSESISYKNIDIAWFEPNGISTDEIMVKKEREHVLKNTLPPTIRFDYENLAVNSSVINRFKKNKLAWFIVWNIYRVLNRMDKYLRRA